MERDCIAIVRFGDVRRSGEHAVAPVEFRTAGAADCDEPRNSYRGRRNADGIVANRRRIVSGRYCEIRRGRSRVDDADRIAFAHASCPRRCAGDRHARRRSRKTQRGGFRVAVDPHNLDTAAAARTIGFCFQAVFVDRRVCATTRDGGSRRLLNHQSGEPGADGCAHAVRIRGDGVARVSHPAHDLAPVHRHAQRSAVARRRAPQSCVRGAVSRDRAPYAAGGIDARLRPDGSRRASISIRGARLHGAGPPHRG